MIVLNYGIAILLIKYSLLSDLSLEMIILGCIKFNKASAVAIVQIVMQGN